MEIVLAYAISLSANAAIDTVVYLLASIIIPEFADGTIVPCRYRATANTVFTRFLGSPTSHTEHIYCLGTLQVVILYSIVTIAACIPSPTVKTLDLDVALVVLTTERRLVVQDIQVFLTKMIHALVKRVYSVRWIRVTRAQVEWVFGVDVGSNRCRRRCVYIGEDRLARGRRERPIVRDEAVRGLWTE